LAVIRISPVSTARKADTRKAPAKPLRQSGNPWF
jgi:hypothetical protein